MEEIVALTLTLAVLKIKREALAAMTTLVGIDRGGRVPLTLVAAATMLVELAVLEVSIAPMS